MILQSDSKMRDTSTSSAEFPSVGWSVAGAGKSDLKRAVSRLEFEPVGDQAVVTINMDEPSAVLPDSLAEELAMLRAKIDGQQSETADLIEAAKTEAGNELRVEYEELLEQKMSEERARITKIQMNFQEQRAKYFSGIEGEVVKLALAIAAKLLHREVKIDPLLLAGVARVALEKIAEGGSITMRVPSTEWRSWQKLFEDSRHPGLEIIADEHMEAGECSIDSRVGSVDLGLAAQLEEVERGFFDLLQRRPA